MASTLPTAVASTVVLPERKYFKIGEVAELVGVEPHVLRYWETQFSQLRPHKARSGHRLYRRREVETLLVIKDLLHIQRFTIAGARQALRQQGTTSLLPRAAEHIAERAVQLSLTPTSASTLEELADEGDDEGDLEGDEVELHLSFPPSRKESLIEVFAKDGEDLDEALAEQLTEQKARNGVSRVVVRAAPASPRPSSPSPSSPHRARARALLIEAARDLERVLAPAAAPAVARR